MTDYLIQYTLNSKNYMDIPQAKDDYLHLRIEDNQEVNNIIEEKLEKIVQNPKENNTSVQVHKAYEISKEIKLKNYNFIKKY